MRKGFKRLISVILLASMMLGICSCDLFEKIHTISTKPVSEAELARLMVEAVNQDMTIADVYEAIPEIQREDISFSYFNMYVDIIRNLTSNYGKVTSFTIAQDDSDMSVYSVQGYGTVDVISLECSNLGDADEPKLYLNRAIDGTAFLDDKWVMDSITLYNYIEHYFDMLDQQNTDALVALLSPYYSDEIHTEEVLYSMAEKLCSYYLLKVKGTSKSFNLVEVNPLEVVFDEPKVIDEDDEGIISREVSVSRGDNGVYFINDTIPTEADSNLVYIYRNDSRLLKAGSDYSSANIYSTLGNPQSIFIDSEVIDSRVTDYGVVEYKRKILLNYRGINLIFEAFITDQNAEYPEFEGRLTSISYFSENGGFEAGNSLSVGMSESDVLVTYPFLDELGYTVSGDDYSVTIIFTDGVISKIKVETN